MRCEVWAAINKPVVVNKPVSLVVNGRSKDRHRKTPERAAYMREYMKRYRARASRVAL